jgi:hypothetical protein
MFKVLDLHTHYDTPNSRKDINFFLFRVSVQGFLPIKKIAPEIKSENNLAETSLE